MLWVLLLSPNRRQISQLRQSKVGQVRLEQWQQSEFEAIGSQYARAVLLRCSSSESVINAVSTADYTTRAFCRSIFVSYVVENRLVSLYMPEDFPPLVLSQA